MPVGVARILFLDVRRIGQHQRAQVLGAGVQNTRPRKPCANQPRQIAAMVEMRVRQDDRVDRALASIGSGIQLRRRSSFSP